jgi:acyl carrier protein phosphodiesterase
MIVVDPDGRHIVLTEDISKFARRFTKEWSQRVQTEQIMNYLAHIFLARETSETMVGALLGDFVKGENRERYGATIEREISIHRKIDTFTDTHLVVSLAKREIGERKRRYAGILLDVFYDHVLAKTWSSYSAVPLSCFTQGFYEALAAYEQVIPANLRLIVPTMIQENWLASYEDFSGVEAAIYSGPWFQGSSLSCLLSRGMGRDERSEEAAGPHP